MDLIDEAIKQMVVAVKDFSKPEYVVKEDRIGYKVQDGISTNVTYGYNTVFAYFQERDNGNITQEGLEANLRIIITCGNYSYAEVARSFARIMGVTGTLKTLGNVQRDILSKDYGISKWTYIPSVYGNSNRVFAQEADTKVIPESNYYQIVRQEIQAQLDKNADEKGKRAVLVFFESKKRVELILGFHRIFFTSC